jgi:hypothetical protein
MLRTIFYVLCSIFIIIILQNIFIQLFNINIIREKFSIGYQNSFIQTDIDDLNRINIIL